MKTLTVVLLLFAGANGCESGSHNTESTATSQNVEPVKNVEPPKFAKPYDSAKQSQIKWSGDFVSSQGTWVSDNPAKQNALPSVSEVECFKNGGRSLVGDSDAYCMVATAKIATIATKSVPVIDVSYYSVVSWGKNRIVAADSATAPFPMCLWSQITIDRQNHIVSVMDSRKIRKDLDKLPGACLAVPLSERYHLMDSSESDMLESNLQSAREDDVWRDVYVPISASLSVAPITRRYSIRTGLPKRGRRHRFS